MHNCGPTTPDWLTLRSPDARVGERFTQAKAFDQIRREVLAETIFDSEMSAWVNDSRIKPIANLAVSCAATIAANQCPRFVKRHQTVVDAATGSEVVVTSIFPRDLAVLLGEA